MGLNTKTKLFIRLSMWENDTQCYLPVGTLIYDNDPNKRVGFVGFIYDKSYISNHWPAIDPAHLDPQVDGGRFSIGENKGNVPHYFASFLPGEFSQQLLSNADHRWSSLTEAEKLYIMTFAQCDFGAAQLNPQNNQFNAPIRQIDELNRLVKLIRDFQDGETTNPISQEIQGALCSFQGPKPKIDYEEKQNGITQRFVAKLNTTGYFNDARITATLSSLERDAGINACQNRVVTLECGEDVLFSYNYARIHRYERNTQEEKQRTILKYNRISFKTLLADDPILGNTQRPNYKHVVYAINKYSADPATDKEELFRRAVLSAATNHTANGLENMEMYDQGMGRWRLSPSFHNLPNPMTDAQFDMGFDESIMTGNLMRFDEKFIVGVGTQFGFDPTKALALSQSVTGALNNIERSMGMNGLSADDRSTVLECLKLKEAAALHQRISSNDSIQKSLGGSLDVPTTGPKGPRM